MTQTTRPQMTDADARTLSMAVNALRLSEREHMAGRVQAIIDRLTAEAPDTEVARPVVDREAVAEWFAKEKCDWGTPGHIKCIKTQPTCRCAAKADALISHMGWARMPSEEDVAELLDGWSQEISKELGIFARGGNSPASRSSFEVARAVLALMVPK